MKLTDNQIRDINKYLEEGKPLPDNYELKGYPDEWIERGIEEKREINYYAVGGITGIDR